MDKEEKDRLRHIRQEMIDLLEEAKNIIRQHSGREIYNRAKHTWIGHLDVALGGGAFVDTHDNTFEKTLRELGIPTDINEEIEEEVDDENNSEG